MILCIARFAGDEARHPTGTIVDVLADSEETTLSDDMLRIFAHVKISGPFTTDAERETTTATLVGRRLDLPKIQAQIGATVVNRWKTKAQRATVFNFPGINLTTVANYLMP